MIKPPPIKYELAEKQQAISVGGLGAMMAIFDRLDLRKRINAAAPVFKLHLPYDEADHVLNIAFNLLGGGRGWHAAGTFGIAKNGRGVLERAGRDANSLVPGRERQTYRILDELIGAASERYRRYALTRLADLYRHHSTDADQQRLNQEIWNRLVTAAANPDTDSSATVGIYDIATNYASVGSLPSHVTKELEARLGNLPQPARFSGCLDDKQYRSASPEASRRFSCAAARSSSERRP